AVDHAQDALDLAAEIGMARRIDDVYPDVMPVDRGAFGQDRNAALAFQLVRIERPLGDLLVGAERAALLQQLIDQRRLAVIDMRDDRYIPDIHSARCSFLRRHRDNSPAQTHTRRAHTGRAQARRAASTSPFSATSGRAPTWLMISAAHRLPILPQVGSGRSRVKPNKKPAA